MGEQQMAHTLVATELRVGLAHVAACYTTVLEDRSGWRKRVDALSRALLESGAKAAHEELAVWHERTTASAAAAAAEKAAAATNAAATSLASPSAAGGKAAKAGAAAAPAGKGGGPAAGSGAPASSSAGGGKGGAASGKAAAEAAAAEEAAQAQAEAEAMRQATAELERALEWVELRARKVVLALDARDAAAAGRVASRVAVGSGGRLEDVVAAVGGGLAHLAGSR